MLYPYTVSLLTVSFIMYIVEMCISYCIYNVNENRRRANDFQINCWIVCADDKHVEILVMARKC